LTSTDTTPLSVLDHIRQIPLEAILAYHGLRPRREGTTTRYKNDQVNIVVGGNTLWFDNAASVGGRGPIDLLPHLKYSARPRQATKAELRDAMRWLATFQPMTGAASPAQAMLPHPPKPKESFAKQAVRFALPDDSRWPMVRRYLIDSRRLPTYLVDVAFQRRDLFASFPVDHPARTGVCFVHRDLTGDVKGATIRPADGGPGIPISIGEKQGAWFTWGDPQNASRLIVTEAPIDALSYVALKRPDDSVVLAMSGCHVYQRVLRLAHERGWELAVGFDNDRAGNAGWERCRENHALLYPDDPAPVQLVPAGKDWNDDLRLAPRLSQGRYL
jgi:hypothetical protein